MTWEGKRAGVPRLSDGRRIPFDSGIWQGRGRVVHALPPRADSTHGQFCSLIVLMDRNDPANGQRMTQQEVAEELRFTMRLFVHRVKLGRVTFTEAVEQGIPMLADKVAESMCRHILFVKKPPLEGHTAGAGRATSEKG